MYNTHQNEVEMVTAGGEDPNPNLGRERRGPACPPPIPAPGFFGMPPQTLPELDLPFPTRLSAHEVGAIDWRLSPCAKLPKARRGGSGGPGSWSVSSSPNPQSCLPLEGKAGIPTPPPQCPPPPPYTYTHLREPAHSLLPARAFQSQDPAPTASEAPKPCNQPAPRSGRPGTKGGKGGKQSSFPFSTPKPAQALSTLAPEMSPTDFLPASSGRWYRDCRSCKGGKEQKRRLGWEKELG